MTKEELEIIEKNEREMKDKIANLKEEIENFGNFEGEGVFVVPVEENENSVTKRVSDIYDEMKENRRK